MFRVMVGWAVIGRAGIGPAASGLGWSCCPAGDVARTGVRFMNCSGGFIEFCAAVGFVASGDRNPDGGGLFTRCAGGLRARFGGQTVDGRDTAVPEIGRASCRERV